MGFCKHFSLLGLRQAGRVPGDHAATRGGHSFWFSQSAVVRVSRASYTDCIELCHREVVTGEQLDRMIWMENRKS